MPLNGKQFGCGHTPKFLQGAGPAKMLVGELPQTRCTSGQIVPKSRALHRSLRPVAIASSPSFSSLPPPARQPRHLLDFGCPLPPPPRGALAFRFRSFFLSPLRRGVFLFFFLWGLGRPVWCFSCRSPPPKWQAPLPAGPEIFTVPRSLVPIEHRAGLGIVHRGSHQPGGFWKARLRCAELVRQLVKAIHCLRCPASAA